MLEMGYEVEKLAFYEISSNRVIPIDLPGDEGGWNWVILLISLIIMIQQNLLW
jgi:hypothetical protein